MCILNSDKHRAAALLTDAFFENPAHVYIFPDAELRRENLHWLMRTNLNAQLSIGESFALRADDNEIQLMGFWHKPGAAKASLFQLARFGFFFMPFRVGWAAFRRMLFAVSEIEARRQRALNGCESWYLNNMVVAQNLRGRGLGKRILRRELEQKVTPSGFPASLSTQKHENVLFYQSLGFQVANDEPVTDRHGRGFPNWIMIFNR